MLSIDYYCCLGLFAWSEWYEICHCLTHHGSREESKISQNCGLKLHQSAPPCCFVFRALSWNLLRAANLNRFLWRTPLGKNKRSVDLPMTNMNTDTSTQIELFSDLRILQGVHLLEVENCWFRVVWYYSIILSVQDSVRLNERVGSSSRVGKFGLL